MVEKEESKVLGSASPMTGKHLVDYFGGVKQEFSAITWTSKEDLLTYAKVVIGATFIFGMFIYLVDLVIQGSLQGISLFARLIGS